MNTPVLANQADPGPSEPFELRRLGRINRVFHDAGDHQPTVDHNRDGRRRSAIGDWTGSAGHRCACERAVVSTETGRVRLGL